jgi:hypothetical protein
LATWNEPERNEQPIIIVLAVADGPVAAILDGLPENVPDAKSYPVPMNLTNMGGNNIILDIGEKQFAFYAHLQPHTHSSKGGRSRCP